MKKYVKPVVEIKEFETEDIILSGTGGLVNYNISNFIESNESNKVIID